MRDPIPGIDSGIVNELAAKRGQRVVDLNMNEAYPGDLNSTRYEERRAPTVLAASKGYDAVIDLHNINGHGEDTACIGSRGVSREVLGFIAWLGIRRVVRTSHNTLHEHVPNSFLFDLSTESERSSVDYLRRAFRYLVAAEPLPQVRADEFAWYRFLANITAEQMDSGQLPAGIEGFDRVPESIAAQMGHPGEPVHMVSWLDEPNAQGYWAEVCTPIVPPDDTHWPLAI